MKRKYHCMLETLLFWFILMVYMLLMFLAVFAVSTAKADGLYLELAASAYMKGLTGDSEWKGDSPGAHIQLYYEWKDQPWYLPDKVGYMHQSNWLQGFPFNHDDEDKLDQLFISKRFKLM